MDLLRSMLLRIEEAPAGEVIGYAELAVAGRDEQEIMQHLALLFDAKFVKGNGRPDRGTGRASIHAVHALTWEGHEYLDTVRNDHVWSETKATISKKGLDLTFEIVKTVATGIIKHQLGLSP